MQNNLEDTEAVPNGESICRSDASFDQAEK